MRSARRQGSSIGGRIDFLLDSHYKNRTILNRIRELSLVARATSALIHELQKERGLSSGFVAGAGRRFVLDLPVQKERTDQALGDALEAWTTVATETRMPPLEAAQGEARASLADLARLRADVRAEALTPNAVVQQFSALIDRLLVVIAEVPGGAPHPQINLALIALLNFILAKEYTGQIRALGSAVCAQGAFEPFQYDRFKSLYSQRAECLSTFCRHASRDQVDQWTDLQRAESFLQWDEHRLALDKIGIEGHGLTPDPGEWYQWSTAAIDTMWTAEAALLDGLEDLCLLILADTRLVWEERVVAPFSVVEGTSNRQGDSAEVLVEASAGSTDELQRWRREIDRLDVVVRELVERARQAKILSLDLGIEAVRRSDMVVGARELAQGLNILAESLESRLEGFKKSADRAIETQEAWHSRALALRKVTLEDNLRPKVTRE